MNASPDGEAWDFSGLRAVFLNCTLNPTGQHSHTEALMSVPRAIMEKHGVTVDCLRPVDFHIAPGIYPDMTEQGFDRDDWPEIFKQVIAADILVIGTPIWLGDKSSVATRVVERLYAHSGETNEQGQYVFYGRAGGCVVTGNEDGIKHCGMNILYSLQHIGYAIPPQADTGWVGEAGPGASYGDDDDSGPTNDYTQRTATFMAWNLMHIARMLKANGGIPAHGNQGPEWEKGVRFGHPGMPSD